MPTGPAVRLPSAQHITCHRSTYLPTHLPSLWQLITYRLLVITGAYDRQRKLFLPLKAKKDRSDLRRFSTWVTCLSASSGWEPGVCLEGAWCLEGQLPPHGAPTHSATQPGAAPCQTGRARVLWKLLHCPSSFLFLSLRYLRGGRFLSSPYLCPPGFCKVQ